VYHGGVAYRLEIVTEVRDWLHQLRRADRASAILLGQAITALLEEGPSLGRPLVDRIQGSALHKLERATSRLNREHRDKDLVYL
jgi:hypothetical protein